MNPEKSALKKHRILWNKLERKQLCEALRRLVAEDVFESSIIALVMAAQREVLPPLRIRTVPCVSRLGPTNHKLLMEAYEAGQRARKSAESGERLVATKPAAGEVESAERKAPAPESTPPVPPVPTPPAAGSPATSPLLEAPPQTPEPTLPSPLPTPHSTLEFASTASLIGELFVRGIRALEDRMDRIEGRLLEAFIQSRMPSSSSIQANGSDSARDGLRRDEPAKPLPVVPNSIIPEPGTLKPRRPVLTVLGLMRDQFEHVRTKCAETCFELRWVDKEASRPSFGRTDYIVAQRHHSHAWWDAAIAAVPKGNAVFSGGGISDTVQRIFDLHAREMALARQGRSSI